MDGGISYYDRDSEISGYEFFNLKKIKDFLGVADESGGL